MPALARWPRSAFETLRSATGSHASWTASYPSASGVRTGTTGHGPASITVTGVTPPVSSSKSCVIPIFLPMIPLISELDLDVDAGREVEPHERVDRLRRRVDDVDQPLVRAHLEVLPRVLVLVRGPDDAVHVLLRGQRHRAGHARAGPGHRVDDLACRAVDDLMVVCLEPDADLLSRHVASVSFALSECRCLMPLSECRCPGHPAGSARAPGPGRSRSGELLDDLGDPAGAARVAALPDREQEALLHRDA